MTDSHIFAAAPLALAITAVIAAGGSDEAEATQVASSLVESNLRGHDSHGIGMVPRYVQAIRDGGLRPNQHARTTLDAGPLLRLEGNRGYGQVIGAEAMHAAIARAREAGACVMLLADSHHLGRIGQFAEMATVADLVSIHFVNVLSRPVVGPWGGADARFGTNPVCVGIPIPGEAPFLLDFATSAVAQGKLRVAHNKGERVKPGLLLDSEGKPTTDPAFAVRPPMGAMMPFGEHKGYGLALACELLGGALSAGGTENGVPRGDQRVVNGMLTIVIDPSRTGSGDAFAQQTRSFLDWLRASPAAGGFDRVRIPGDPERESRERRLAQGIPVDATTWRDIGDAAEQLGLSREDVDRLARGG